MRLIATPDSTVNYVDRALWLTGPFDKWNGSVVTPASRTYTVPAEDRVYEVSDG